MATYIPGAQSLGYGFNVFGAYDDSSKIKPLFNMTYKNQTWKNYLVPENVNLDPSSHNSGSSNFFSSRQKVEEHFSSKLSIKAKYGFFTGQFQASFNMTNKSDVSYQYGLVETYSKQYALDLKDSTENALADWVKNDADYKNIPDTFTDANRLAFFRFFDKYGIVYISGVSLGARLYYSTAISKSHTYSEKEIKTKLDLEYKAIFSAKATAEANWKQTGEAWTSRREVKVSTTGGDNSILNVLIPGYGANHEEGMKAWLASSQNMPAVIDFKLTSISEIFSGNKALAVEKAIQAYVQHKLLVESKTGTCLINFNGKSVLPSPDGISRTFGYQLVAINRSNLLVEFQKSYASDNYWGGYEALYNTMLKEIKPYDKPDFIIVFTTFTNFALTAPNAAFAKFLEGCGAYTGLRTWLDTKSSNYGIYSCCALAHCNYAMVGIPGSAKGSAHEAYERAGSCDTGVSSWNMGSADAWLDKAATAVSLNVDIYMLKGGAKAGKKGASAKEGKGMAYLVPQRP